jgi:hypothetical protein
LWVPKRVNVSTAQPSPSRRSSEPTPNIASMLAAPAAWCSKAMSVRSSSGSSAGEAWMGALRSTNRGIGEAAFGAKRPGPAPDLRKGGGVKTNTSV